MNNAVASLRIWIAYAVLLHLSSHISIVNCEMQIQYCDGDDLITLTHHQCSGGINFEGKTPPCVCMTGIYRMWSEGCNIYDGFALNACSDLITPDEYFSNTSYFATGIRMPVGAEVNDFFKETVIVLGANKTDYETWQTIGSGQSALMRSTRFYGLNADVYLRYPKSDDSAEPPRLCIKRKEDMEDNNRVCRYSKEEYNDFWQAEWGALNISLAPEASVNKSNAPKEYCGDMSDNDDLYALEKLETDDCFPVITNAQSECTLSCKLPKKSTEVDNESDSEEGNKKPPTKFGTGIKNCKEPTMGEISTQHNSFLNRKLNHWSKLRQVGQLDKPTLSKIQPTRTFRILDIAKQIAQNTCEHHVSPIFFDQAVDLFVVLHKGRDYRYTEDLEEKDFKWIQKILHTCNMNSKTLPLYTAGNENGCDDFEKVQGYCKSGRMENSDCEKIPLNISDTHSDFKHHFVVDAAWNLIDLIQIVCFDEFAESYRMFHAWEQSSEKLFTREIRKLWVQPDLDRRVYQNLLTPTAVIDIWNLEMCIEAAYQRNPVLTRLLRPPEPKRYFRRKKRQTDELDRVGKVYDVFCRKNDDEFTTPC